jgi:hypothetical protein
MIRTCAQVFVLYLLSVTAVFPQNPQAFPTVSQVKHLRSLPSWGGFEASCGPALDIESHPAADFSPPPHYSAQGAVPEAKSDAVPTLRRESLAVYKLALCFEISGDKRFSAKAESILDGWAHTTKKIGTLQGADGFNFYFPYALLGASILKQDATWNQNDLNSFVKSVVIPANNSNLANNHGNWGVLLLSTAANYLGDAPLLAKARQRWLDIVQAQVAPDGSLPLEICRSDTSNWCGGPTKGIRGIAYTNYTLYPTTIAAEVFTNLGQDVYATPQGALLCNAYGKAAAWVLHPETFPYFASNTGKLQDMRTIDYFYILQSRCPAPDGVQALKKFGSDAPDPLDLRLIYGQHE